MGVEPKKLLVVFGTRPEAIKLAPLILKLSQQSQFKVEVCHSGQHATLADDIVDCFELEINYRIEITNEDQSLSELTSSLIKHLSQILEKSRPDLVIVQGDTATTLAGAMAASYSKIPIAHVEAGLRSGNKLRPFPEEMNRRLISTMADLHFAPTEKAVDNLKSEGTIDKVYEVGNTGIDALRHSIEKVDADRYEEQNPSKKQLLVTIHRRENWGRPLKNVIRALSELATNRDDISIEIIVHPNPKIKKAIYSSLSHTENITLHGPVAYEKMVLMLMNTYLILTDSGGLQEEAVFLGIPTLVLRDETERKEGADMGTLKVIGTSSERIIEEVSSLLKNEKLHESMKVSSKVFGDGSASSKINEVLLQYF